MKIVEIAFPPRRERSNLLAAVRALAQSMAGADDDSLHGRVPSGMATKRWYAPIFAGEGLDAWLVWWSSEGDIELHDHGGASGAIYVLEGGLLETHGTGGDRGLRLRALSAGGSIAFGPEYVHDLINPGPEPALSLHVYGPRLDTMTYYRVDNRSGRLLPERCEPVEPVAGMAPATSTTCLSRVPSRTRRPGSRCQW